MPDKVVVTLPSPLTDTDLVNYLSELWDKQFWYQVSNTEIKRELKIGQIQPVANPKICNFREAIKDLIYSFKPREVKLEIVKDSPT